MYVSAQYRHAFTCTLQMITLQCPATQTINITSAIYGDYAYACADATCCVPHPTDDCTDAMNAIDFNVLKLFCDGQESCEFEAQAQAIDCVGEAVVSSYLSVYYECLPGNVTATTVHFVVPVHIARIENQVISTTLHFEC